MNSPFQPKKLNVPGLMGDDAINEQLKQFATQGNAAVNSAPPPSSAVDMVDRIQKEYLDKPTPSIRGVTAALPGPLGLLASAAGAAGAGQPPAGPAPVDPQQQAVDVRSNILSDAAAAIPAPLRDFVLGPVVGELGQGGTINALGTLTPEQQQAEADQRAKDSAANEIAIRAHADMRDKLRGLTDDQATAMGLPVPPGGTQPETAVLPSATTVPALKLTPQEQNLYQHHVDNIQNGKFVRNPDGSISTLYQTSVDIDGKTYNFPTVWDGKILPPDEAVQRALKEKPLDQWPSYKDPAAAEARYGQMHQAIAPDVAALEAGLTQKEQNAAADQKIVAEATKRNQEAIAATKDPSLQPKQTWWLNAMQSGAKGAAEMGIGGVRFLTELSEMGRDVSGLDLVTGGGRSNARAWIDTVDATLTKMLPGDKARSKDFITQLSQGGGSMAGFMLAGFVGAAAGIPAGLATAVVGAATQGDQQFQDAENFKATSVQKYLALIAGAVIGTSEAIPIDRMFMRADAMTGGLVRRLLNHTVASSLEEFTQEFGQAVGQDVVAKLLYDEKRKFDMKSYLLQGAVGALSGGLTAAAVTALHDSGVSTQPADATPVEQRQSIAENVIANLRVQLDSLPGMSEHEAATAAEQPAAAATALAAQEAPPAAPPAAGVDMAAIAASDNAVKQGETNAVPVAPVADTGALVDISPDVAAQIVPSDSVSATDTRALVPIGRDESNGKVLAVPEDLFAQQTKSVTETPAFKNWFGDSKVVDQSGAPLVVYHGTPDARGVQSGEGFKTLVQRMDQTDENAAFFFSTSLEVARTYADATRAFDYQGAKPAVMPVFLSMDNPATVDWGGKRWRGTDEAIKEAKAAGRDGLIIRNVRDAFNAGLVKKGDKTSTVHVVFKPTQIKSAFNGGNFDPTNPDILANVGPRPRVTHNADLARPQGGVPGEAKAGELADVNLAKISSGFTKLMGATARQGRITAKGMSAGQMTEARAQYDRAQGVIRVKTTDDVSSLVHEGGHDLYFSAGDHLKSFITRNDTGLMKVADELYGGDTNVMPKWRHVAEGFAEFFRVYTLNRAYAENHYGQLVSDFDTVLDRDAPQLKAGLQIVGQQYAAWMQMPSAQVVRNMIVSGQQTGTINEAMKELAEAGFATWMHEYARRSVDASVNRFASLNDLVSQTLNIAQDNAGKALDLKRSEDPRVLMRLAANTGARAMVEVTDGVMGHNSTAPMTRSLREALLRYHGKNADQNLFSIDPVRQQDFAAYLVALRGIDEFRRLSEGKIKRMPLGDKVHLPELSNTVRVMEGKYGTDFSEAAKIVHEYAMGLWQKSFDAGLMSRETYLDGLDRQFYAPLQRDMSDRKASLGASALTGASSLVKRFGGSGRSVIDPMDVLMHKTFALERIINRNEVFRTLAKLAERAGKAGAMIERIPATQLMGKQLSVAEAARALAKDDTLTEADAQDLMEILQASIENDNVIDYFRSEPIHTKGENILFGWEDGRLSALQLADGDLGADVVNVVNGLGRENLPLFTNLIGTSSTIFRAGIVSWPDFLVANFIKDQFSTFILTDVGYKPFYTGVKGMFDELRQANWGRQYNATMGSMGGMNVANMHNARIDRDIGALRGKGYIVKAFTGDGNVFTNGINGLMRTIELSETGTRIGVFKSAYERAKTDGLSDWDASIEASYTAMDLMDFGLNGSRTALFRKTIPFLNAQLQGLYKMARTLGADEVRQRKGLNFVVRAYFKSMKNIDLSRTEKQAINTGRKAWIKMASLGLISAALHFLFKDDPDYQEAGEYLRTTGWVIPLGDGHIFFIPKPYELAILANFTERALETSEGDTEAMSRFMRGLAMTFTPPVSPPLVKTAVELQANKDFFSGTEIVPSYMQALAPELQFNNYTSSLAKQLGHALNMSPLKIDHVMSSLGATAYRDLMSMYNTTDPNRGNMQQTDVPVLRRFIRDVRRGSTSSQDFWGIASTLNGTLRSAETTYKAYLDAGNEHAANDFLNTLGEDEKAYAILNTDFKADAKRLNPFYRARQLTTIVSAMRREMVTPLGLADTTTKTTPEMKLSAKEKSDLDTALSEYARREMRNTLVAMSAPGWAGKKMVDTKTTINLIGKIEPRVRDELLRRIDKAKVYDFKTITNYWPEVKNRLLRDRENTFLDDILSVAKVMR